MVVYNAKLEDGEENIKPIRGSIILLAMKLMLLTIIFDITYSFIFYLLNRYFNLPLNLHDNFASILLILFITKNLIEVTLLIYLVLSWANTLFYIQNNHLVIKRGIFHTYEDVYDFKTIRSIEVEQSLIGKILHFGNIILRSSASGGYQVMVTLLGLSDPQKQERILNRYF
jgi:uncharacterized membrane protein YdbT with pleckstrin-like domain